MQASVVIPVWNGEKVIADCLEAIIKHSGSGLKEVVCVDNASSDRSATIIAERFPQVRLLRRPVNLGFAGGVNQGIEAATTEIFVLINQDCLVEENWLAPLVDAFTRYPDAGILGGTILDADGAVNHTGAYLQHPDAFGIHQQADPSAQVAEQLEEAEYVTGALFAIRRDVWSKIGPLDEGFYPAYYEEVDYCYRARHHGFKIAYVPQARAVHYFSSREWQKDPLAHAVNQHRSRYQFIAKHFEGEQLEAFFVAEMSAIPNQTYRDQIVGRLLAAQATSRHLSAICARRQQHLAKAPDPIRQRLLEVRFRELRRAAYEAAYAPLDARLNESRRRLNDLQKEKEALLDRIFFHPPTKNTTEARRHRWWRTLVLRPLSLLLGRERRLLARLSTLHTMHTAQIEHHQQLLEKKIELQRTVAVHDYL